MAPEASPKSGPQGAGEKPGAPEEVQALTTALEEVRGEERGRKAVVLLGAEGKGSAEQVFYPQVRPLGDSRVALRLPWLEEAGAQASSVP